MSILAVCQKLYILKLFTHDEKIWCEPKNVQGLSKFILEYMNKTFETVA